MGQTSKATSNSEVKPIVYIFLLHDCVICQSYAPYLEDLNKKYEAKFTFIGIFPNFISKPQEIESFKTSYGITFETKTDYYKTLSKKFEVTVTPEVVIFDENSNHILYKGRIDDSFLSIGKRKQVTSHHDLEDALNGIALGTNFENATKAVGCFINFGELKE